MEGFRRGRGLMATISRAAAGAESPLYQAAAAGSGAEDTLAFEEAAMEAYEARLAEFRDEKRSYLY